MYELTSITLLLVYFIGSTEVIVYSAQGINDPVTSAMHIIFGNNFIFNNLCRACMAIRPISINLLAFYHECCSLIGYATHVF